MAAWNLKMDNFFNRQEV